MTAILRERGKDYLFPAFFSFSKKERDTCKATLLTVDHSLLSEATERVQAECILFASDHDELYDTLRVLQRISEYQDVSVKKCTIGNVHIIKDAQNDPVSNERELCKLFIDTFRINRFATDVHVEDCGLPSQVIKHLIDQLRGCNDLTKLVLSKLEFPDNLGDVIASMSSCEIVQLNGTLEKGRLLAGLSHSFMLKILEINRCTLSDQVSCLFGDSDHPGFRQLEKLSLVDTKLRKVDLKSISSAVANGKLPLLNSLDLSGNVLTDCIRDLLGSSNQSRVLCLKHLYLSNAKLSKNDLDSIAVAVQCDKLRKVELLDLSDNVLKDILSTLIPLNVHPGYKSLKRLNVSNCKLSTSHIKSVMIAFRFGKLPNLRTFQKFPQRVSHEWLSDFLITDHPACRVAVSLDLQKKGLHEADIKSYF